MLERQGDPRFGPTHNPLIPQTKLSKQGNLEEIAKENEIVKPSSKDKEAKFFSFEKVPSQLLQNMLPL